MNLRFAELGMLGFHRGMNIRDCSLFVAVLVSSVAGAWGVNIGTNQTPSDWRGEKRVIDLHQHIDYTPEHLAREIHIMDVAGIGLGVLMDRY